MKLKTVIVEDEQLGQDVITGILSRYCDEMVEIIGVTASVDESVKIIREKDPDLVFLDIKLGVNENGAFDILNAFDEVNFRSVFTTSAENSEYILRAVNKYGAKKYLLKPLDIDEVVDAVTIVHDEIQSLNNSKAGNNNAKDNRCINLKVPQKNGFRIVKCNELIMLRSNANSTMLFLTSGENILSSKNLSHYELILKNGNFLRVSRSFIINNEHIISYSSEDGGTIFLSNDCTAALSDRYKDDFLQLFGG